MSDLHLFAGGNTSQGFYSCFEDILPKERRKRMFYLKGGPGVGKSTLMRRAAQAAAIALPLQVIRARRIRARAIKAETKRMAKVHCT